MSVIAAVDIGGTDVKVGLVKNGEIVVHESIRISNYSDPASLLIDVSQLSRQMANCRRERIVGVGVACAGLVDRDAGEIISSPNIPFLSGFQLTAFLAAELEVPANLENDATAAAMCEYYYGGWGKPRMLLTLTLGTGVGGGVVIEGQPLRGASNMAAEFGHVKVPGVGRRKCGCGRYGCIEAYVGRDGILRTAQRLLKSTAQKAGEGDAKTPWSDVGSLAAAARDGNQVALATFHFTGRILGRGIATLIDAFNPDLVVLSGGIAQSFPLLENGIQSSVKKFCSFDATRDAATIVPSFRPRESGLLGAAATIDWSTKVSEAEISGKLASTNHFSVSGPSLEDNAPVLGLHIGATSYGASITQWDGKILAYSSTRCNVTRASQPYEQFLRECEEAVQKVLREAAGLVTLEQITACGVVVPVTVPEPRTAVGFAPALENLKGQPLAMHLSERLAELLGHEIAVELENDGNAMALAEWLYGAAKGLSDFVVFRLCTGVGCGIFTKGKLNRGSHGLAGEVGHQRVDPHGDRCNCGNIGCLETVTSGRHLLEVAKKRTMQDFQSYHDVVTAALSKEIQLDAEFEQIGGYLGRTISGIINFQDPQCVIVGGPIAKAYPLFERALLAEVFTFPDTECNVLPSALDRSEAIAALATVRYYSTSSKLESELCRP